MSLEEKVRTLEIGSLQRHVFVCRGPECCSSGQGEVVWNYLKARLKELGLSEPGGGVFRTKADCLRICERGPIVLVYPEGVWYHSVDQEKMERIIQGHLMGGVPLEEEAFVIRPLPSPSGKV